MHLAQGMTTIRKRNYKPVMTKKNIAKWEAGLIVHNRNCKRNGEPKLTFNQYVDYCHGITTKVDIRSDRSRFKPQKSIAQKQIDEFNKKYPSVPMDAKGGHNCGKKETMKYTGDLITGIATMHKSNAVPVVIALPLSIILTRLLG